MTSATARLGKLRVNGDETMLTFKAEQSKHSLQRRGYFQVKVKSMFSIRELWETCPFGFFGLILRITRIF